LVLNTTWPTRTRSQASSTQQYHQFPKGARLRQRPCREYFERLVNAGRAPRDVCSKLRTTWAAVPDAVHRPGIWAWGSSLRAEPRFRYPHCSIRHKILVSAAAIVHEQIVGAPGADWNLGFRRFAQPPELKPFTSIASREKLWGGDISGPTTPVTVHGP